MTSILIFQYERMKKLLYIYDFAVYLAIGRVIVPFSYYQHFRLD